MNLPPALGSELLKEKIDDILFKYIFLGPIKVFSTGYGFAKSVLNWNEEEEWALRVNSHKVGTSLVVQWVRLHPPSAGGMSSIPGLGTKIPHASRWGQKKKSLGRIIFQRRQWKPTPVLLPGKSHERRSLVGCSPWSREESDATKRLHFHFSLSCIGEGNGNPLQCSCLENPRDSGAWWAAVYGVAQSPAQLKWFSSSSSRIIFSISNHFILYIVFPDENHSLYPKPQRGENKTNKTKFESHVYFCISPSASTCHCSWQILLADTLDRYLVSVLSRYPTNSW